MNAPPQVSALICAFNAQDTIAIAIDSVLAQTFSDLEVLVIDDGSSDSTAEIVASIMSRDQRVRLITQQNAGIAGARNCSIREARGAIVAFLDADDFWTPEHLSVHCDMLKTQSELSVAFANALHVDATGKETGQRSRTQKGDVSPRSAFSGNPATTCSSMVIRRSVFDAVGPFVSGLDHAEDQEWILRLLLRGYRMACSGKHTIAYRANPNGQSSDLARMLRGFHAVRDMALREAPDFAARYAGEAEGRICLYLARRAILLGQGSKVAAPYLARAMAHLPALIVAAPMQLAAAILAVMAPPLSRRISGLSRFREART